MNSLSRLTERTRHTHKSVNWAFKSSYITQSTNLELFNHLLHRSFAYCVCICPNCYFVVFFLFCFVYVLFFVLFFLPFLSSLLYIVFFNIYRASGGPAPRVSS